MAVLDRFLRYVQYDTQSDDRSSTYPSTEKQLVLMRDLVEELQRIGLTDAAMDAHGYVTATVPATTTKRHVPTIGFIAHVDTSPEMPGDGVKPLVHRDWDGRDIVLPDAPDAVLLLKRGARATSSRASTRRTGAACAGAATGTGVKST